MRRVEQPLPGRRLSVIGTTGAGKTSTAAMLARVLGLRHIELDALYWGRNWTAATDDAFRASVEQATQGAGWVVDGNYRAARDIAWPRADTIVWLDFRLDVVMRRLIVRTVRRLIRNEELWNGNRERWREVFASRDSILLWGLTSHRRRRQTYKLHLASGMCRNATVIRLRSPAEAEAWLDWVASSGPAADADGQLA